MKANNRKALLAKVHIAVSQLGIQDEDYRDILQAMFRVRSSAELSDRNLEQLIRYFVSKGFVAKKLKADGSQYKGTSQIAALRIRAKGLLDKAVADGSVSSARGLVKSICGVEELAWCKDVMRVKRLLAALDSIGHSAKGKAQKA